MTKSQSKKLLTKINILHICDKEIDDGKITAAQVKELRERTGAGMMDVKKALVKPMVIWIRLQIF